MRLGFTEQDEAFRLSVVRWLKENLSGEFEQIRGRGGPSDEHTYFEARRAWERRLRQGGWTCIGWPKEYGGRGCTLEEQVIFQEEYARAGGPGRVGHIGEGLIGPTLIAYGSKSQKERFLPPILSGEVLWCQGYSEPSAGSDLANISTKAVLKADTQQWEISGQKIWTSLARESQWCFLVARTDPESKGHQGLGFFLVALDQAGVEVRPIQQLTGTSEFNEVFFDQAVCDADCLVGAPGDGWKIAMGLLEIERGVSTLGQQMLFKNQLDMIIAIAKHNGAAKEPLMRARIADAWRGLKIIRYNAMRMLSANRADGQLDRAGLTSKLFWASWHRNLGNLAMDVLGPEAELAKDGPYDLTLLQSLFLFTRSDTIYGGTNQIQRNIIAERGLGLPREARPG